MSLKSTEEIIQDRIVSILQSSEGQSAIGVTTVFPDVQWQAFANIYPKIEVQLPKIISSQSFDNGKIMQNIYECDLYIQDEGLSPEDGARRTRLLAGKTVRFLNTNIGLAGFGLVNDPSFSHTEQEPDEDFGNGQRLSIVTITLTLNEW